MIPRSFFRIVLVLGLLLPAVAQDAPPALHEQVAKEFEDTEARLKSLEERIAGTLDEAKRTELAAVQEKWIAYRDASVALTVGLFAPKPELAEYFRYLELNKLTRDRLTALERMSKAPISKP